MAEAGIEVERLTKVYSPGKPPALLELTLRIEPGETVGLVGPNGAGKTTFLGCLLGLLRPTRGSVRIDGMTPDALTLRAATGYLPERLDFQRWMTGREFLSFHHALAARPKATAGVEVAALLTRVGLERSEWDEPLRTYSRGMLQRLGLAQALIGEPRFVFLDEPTSGMDPTGALAFREIVAGLKARGVTVVVNSHQLDQLERVCDRVVFIKGGAVEAIEDLRASSAGPATIAIRFAQGSSPSPEILAALAAEAQAHLLEHGAGRSRFAVTDERQVAELIRGLVERGVAVVEATPEGGRLDKFFRPGASA